MPGVALFFVIAKHAVFRRKEWHMVVRNVANPFEKEIQIICLGESGQLRRVVEPHVNYKLYFRSQKSIEKPLGGRLGEADRMNYRVLGHCDSEVSDRLSE